MSKKDQAHAHRWQSRVHNWLIMPQSSGITRQRPVTQDELAKHKVGSGSTNKEMWMAVNGYVYDVTRFAQFHPGGVLLMQKYSGMDATVVYAKNHTNVPPEDVIGNFKIGPLVANGTVPAPSSAGAAPSSTKTGTTTPTLTSQPRGSVTSSTSLGVPATTTAGASSLAPPPNTANLRFPPSAAAAVKYERQPHKNPSNSPALLEPFGDVVAAARNSRLFDSVPDDELSNAVFASRNIKRAKRDARDPLLAHGAVDGTPSEEAIKEEEADDLASIECVFDLLDAEHKGAVRTDQLETFLVNIGGFPDGKAAREWLRERMGGKVPTTVTKAQFVELANSL